MFRRRSTEAADVPSGTYDGSPIAALASASGAALEIVERELRGIIASHEAQALRHETAIDNISQGACFLNGEQRLILCNRRYREIYRLTPEQVHPGVTLREIAQHRLPPGHARWRSRIIWRGVPLLLRALSRRFGASSLETAEQFECTISRCLMGDG